MPVELSESEIGVLRKALQHGEKNIRFWPKFRWVQLVLALLAIATAVHSIWVMETIANVSSLSELEPEQAKLMELIDDAVEMRTDIIRTELRLHITALIFGSVGLLLLLFTWIWWRGKAQEIAMVANLQRILAANDESEEST